MNELQLLTMGPSQDVLALTRKQKRRLTRFSRTRRFSANLVVDIGNTTDYRPSIVALGSGSDLTVGVIVDLLHAHGNTNLFVVGNEGGSGAIEIRVQTSDALTSGSFTDPTSGLAQMPSAFASGGVFFANSGLHVSGNYSLSSVVDSAPLFCSGGIQFAHFQRPHRYARLINNSGSFPGSITAGFIGQKHVTGSGGGFSYSPGSGSVNV